MTMTEFIKSRGFTVTCVAKKMGISKQYLSASARGRGSMPTMKTCKRVANALTELGAPTTIAELVTAVWGDEE